MAKRVINSKIEFAYVSDSIDVELKAELEKYFLFQSILVVDSHFEFGDKIAKLQRKYEIEKNRSKQGMER